MLASLHVHSSKCLSGPKPSEPVQVGICSNALHWPSRLHDLPFSQPPERLLPGRDEDEWKVYDLGEAGPVHFGALCYHWRRKKALLPSGLWLVGTFPPFQLRRRSAERALLLPCVWIWSRVAVFLHRFHADSPDPPFVPWRYQMQAEIWCTLGQVLSDGTLQDHSLCILMKAVADCNYIVYSLKIVLQQRTIGNCRNVRGLGKSKVVFCLFEKLRYSNERSTKFKSLYQE